MDCREFENILWESPAKFADREELSPEMAEHLKQCHKCQHVYSNFFRLFELSKKTEISKDDEYWQSFENKVWDKIDQIQNVDQTETARKSTGKEFIRQPEIGLKHLIVSLGVAASAVFFMFIALSDVTQQMAIPKKSPVAEKGRYQITSPLSQVTPHPFKVVLSKGLENDIQLEDFSILPEPKVEPVDTGALVAIDAVYLTDTGIKNKNIEIASALSKEIVMGETQFDRFERKALSEESEPAEKEWIITLEKMPVMKRTVTPKYPTLAYRLKKQGEVWIKAHVDIKGRVTEAKIYKDSGTDYGFEDEALKAAYKNEFEPFEIDNKKLPVWVIYKIRFVMKE